MYRVAILFDTFGPYHYARLNAAQERLEILGMELCGNSKIYDWARVTDPPTFQHLTLFPKRTSDFLNRAEQRETFTRVLQEFRPHAVAIPGWGFHASLILLETCLKLQIPAIILSESAERDQRRSWYRELPKRRSVALFSSGLVGGRSHREYLAALGMPADRIFEGYDIVDNAYFARGAEEARSQLLEVKNKFNLPKNYFLASARFIEKKNLARLIQAYGKYRQMAENRKIETWNLILLGDGPLRSSLSSLLASLHLQDHVQMPGFFQYSELPAYYASARAFIHASTIEQWGLVVNEAMAAGLPVLVSKRCGCAGDLVQEGANGFTFDPENTDEIAKLMMRMTAMPLMEYEKLKAKSLEIISSWSPECFARALERSVAAALNTPRPRFDMSSRLLLSWLTRGNPSGHFSPANS